MKPSSIILVVKEISKQTLERNKLSQAIDKNRYYTLILAKRPRSDSKFFSNFGSRAHTYLPIEVAKDIH